MSVIESRNQGPDADHAAFREQLRSSHLAVLRELVNDRDRQLTEPGNAARLVALCGAKLRYVVDWGKWLEYRDDRWEVVPPERVLHVAAESVRKLGELAQDLLTVLPDDSPDRDWAKGIKGWATASEQVRRLSAVVKYAAGFPSLQVRSDQIDADPWLLGVANGVVDLRTGTLLAPDPARLVTKRAGCAFDPAATCPRWDAFLRQIHPDSEVAPYLQKVFGYTLTGLVREQKAFLHTGSGRNGKGVSVDEIMRAIMGDYAVTLHVKVLTASKADRHPTELAKLHGARLVIASEPPSNAAVDVALFKALTGADKMSVRHMGEDFWTLTPTHKIHLLTNYDLTTHGDDRAFWARVVKVPYTQNYQGREDPELAAKLADELPGILAWCVRGCLAWQRAGLQPLPKLCADAIKDYRDQQDIVADFLAECTNESKEAFVARKDMRAAFEAFCREQGEPAPMHAKAFCEALRRKDVSEHKSDGVRGWKGRALTKVATSDRRALVPPVPVAGADGKAPAAQPKTHAEIYARADLS